MEEDEYKATYAAYNTVPCPFEKALLTACCQCENFERLNIADREAAGCTAPVAQINCRSLLDLLRENARFTLGMTSVGDGLPHAKEIKVQCGGMSGLRQALPAESPAKTAPTNIHGVINAALDAFGSFDHLPFTEIIQGISQHKGRLHRGKTRR